MLIYGAQIGGGRGGGWGGFTWANSTFVYVLMLANASLNLVPLEKIF
jgi:hypothetical protein